ncbi:c2H2-type domain-containing protein [Trichonephila clavipes]|uniref:C2H2-type domain-containing protein n=1 Tax=Trichonephila clavipes TaxID=2585209 RepID=A0A8X7BI38_TRICX|nr:c2H2-type domain-containing protein [Trichonephila clavipes]
MIKNVEFKTPNNEVLQETNLARLYDDMSEKIVKESEDFEGRDSGWTLDEILRLEVRTNRYSPFRGSSSFIEVPKQIAETKAIINVINKKDSQCFMWSILAALYPSTSNPNKTSSYVPHLNKLNFDGISFPTPLNEVKKFSKMNDIGINIYSFEEDLKIFPLLISDIVCEKHIDLLYVKNGEFGHYCFIKSLSRLVSKQLSKHQHKTFICKRSLSAFQTEYKLLQHNEMCMHKNPARVVMPSETNLFENFRKICMQTYKLDPCWYFTTPALSWDVMLLHTKVAIELFTDYDMLLFIEKGVRGGISQCCNRYAIANNRYMSNFNPDDEIKYLMYLDANNLYGYAMSKYLPLKDFVWSDNDLTEQDILNLSDESDVGYILEVDLEYPSDLHDKHSDFPLAPENKRPPNCKEPRLLTTLEPKTKYVLHYSNLKLYLKLGLVLKKIHRVLKFFQSPWLKNYIDYNTKLRTKSVNDFQKDYYKLTNNSIFGKTMENVRRVDIRLCSTEEQARKLIAKSNFNRRTIFSENLMAVHLKKTQIKFFKPIQVGMVILDISKVLMYSFHYEYMKHR